MSQHRQKSWCLPWCWSSTQLHSSYPSISKWTMKNINVFVPCIKYIKIIKRHSTYCPMCDNFRLMKPTRFIHKDIWDAMSQGFLRNVLGLGISSSKISLNRGLLYLFFISCKKLDGIKDSHDFTTPWVAYHYGFSTLSDAVDTTKLCADITCHENNVDKTLGHNLDE